MFATFIGSLCAFALLALTLFGFRKQYKSKYDLWRYYMIEGKDKILTCPYSKVAKMELNTLIDIYRLNPTRFKYEKVTVQVGCYSPDYKYYEYILYNGNQEDGAKKKVFQRQSYHPSIGNYYYEEEEIVGTIPSEEIWKPETTANILLSRPDYNKFCKLVKKYREEQDKREKQEKELQRERQLNLDTQFVLEKAQKDINRLKEFAQKDIVRADEMMKEILRNEDLG